MQICVTTFRNYIQEIMKNHVTGFVQMRYFRDTYLSLVPFFFQQQFSLGCSLVCYAEHFYTMIPVFLGFGIFCYKV